MATSARLTLKTLVKSHHILNGVRLSSLRPAKLCEKQAIRLMSSKQNALLAVSENREATRPQEISEMTRESASNLAENEVYAAEMIPEENVSYIVANIGGSMSNDGGSRSSDNLPGASPISHDSLVEEFSGVYSKFKNNQELAAASEEESSSSNPALEKAKELYAESLRRARFSEEVQGQEDATTEGFKQCAGLLPRRSYDFLGIHTVYGGLLRAFSTSAAANRKDLGHCDKAKKLPCIQSSELSDEKPTKIGGSNKGVCERFCMPCCRPARDPPICFYPYIKAPCHKKKAPTPAFSECKLMFPLRQVKPCECHKPIVGTCKKVEVTKCTK